MNWWTTKLQSFATLLATRHHIPWILSAGCCTVELENVAASTYDWQRLGMDDIAQHPAQADMLIVAGWINPQRAEEIKSAHAQMRKPSVVLAIGACALSGSPYAPARSMTQNDLITVGDIIPVDMSVPGCPPRPEALLDAIIELQRKLNPGPVASKVLHEAFRER